MRIIRNMYFDRYLFRKETEEGKSRNGLWLPGALMAFSLFAAVMTFAGSASAEEMFTSVEEEETIGFNNVEEESGHISGKDLETSDIQEMIDAFTSESEETDTLGQEIVDFALQYVGNPYAWGGISLTDGADCSGFVLSVFARFGYELPHYAASQADYGEPVDMSELEPGDLVFYGWGDISHVAIYKGDGEIVHAENEAYGICVTPVDYSPVICCRRLV